MKTFLGLSVGLALCASFAAAQSTPDFSGTWEPVGSAGGNTSGLVQTVVHKDGTLTLAHASEGGGHRFVYKTDGSQSHSTLMDVTSVATVTVKGDALTMVRVSTYPDGRIRENTQVWSLDAEGHLVIESKDGLRGEAPTIRKTVYKKRVLSKH
jgi:hypothetical protein